MPASDTAPVRPGEELDVQRLSAYLQGKIPGAENGIAIEQFPSGHSNLTYLIRADNVEYVLRRPPFGPIPPKAHDMAREYNVLCAIHPVFPQAPRVFHLCEDTTVIGANFFIMERRHGIVLRDAPPHDAGPSYARKVSEGFADCLIQLHNIDLAAHGLTALGRPDGFLERQVRGWADRWTRAKTEEIPAMEFVIAWLGERVPVPQRPAFVHNDYKLDNLMLNTEDPGRVEAVLDWEMATTGDPLVDLGLALCYWSPPTSLGAINAVTAGRGWFTRDQFVDRYANGTGLNVSNLRYYEVFGAFKLAVILQQIYYRFHAGHTRDERFRNFNERVRDLANAGAALAAR